LCDLPLLLTGFGLLLFPWLGHFGGGLNLDILGQVRWPWQRAFTALPPAGYILLLWAGPWVTLPFFLKLASGVKLYLNRMATTAKSEKPVRVRPGALFLTAVVFYAALGVWTTTVYPPTGDEPHYLLMTHSLIQDHDLDLANNMERRDFQAFYPAAALDFHTAPTSTGKLLSKHFPLLSFLLIPGYALAGRYGALLLIVLAAAGIALLVYRLARSLGAAETSALTAWAVAAMSPPLAIYFDLIYTELPAALIFIFGVYAWLQGGRRGVRLAALAAVALPWFYPKYIPLAAVLGLALPWARDAKVRDLAAAAGLAALSGLLYAFFFRSLYGYSLAGNPFGELHSLFSRHGLTNALGLLADRDFGLIPSNPALLLGVVGLMAFTRTRGRTPGLPLSCTPARAAGFFLAMLTVQYLLYIIFDDFTGSSAVFSRHFLPAALPLFALIPWGWDRLRQAGRGGRSLALLLAACGVLIGWLCAACPVLRYLSPKIALWDKLGFEPYLFPSLALHPGWVAYLWAMSWLVLLAWLLWRASRPRAGA